MQSADGLSIVIVKQDTTIALGITHKNSFTIDKLSEYRLYNVIPFQLFLSSYYLIIIFLILICIFCFLLLVRRRLLQIIS